MPATWQGGKALKHYGPLQLAARLGLAEWQFDAALHQGLIPRPDVDGRRWSAALAHPLADQVTAIVAAVGAEHPIGGHRAAARLADRTGLDVDRPDIEALVDGGLLSACDDFKGWPLYDPRALDALEVETVAAVVADRKAWLAASLPRRAAAAELGWQLHQLDQVVAERGIPRGRFGRYARSDLAALAGDQDLAEQVAADRLLGPEQAAAHLEVRRVDLEYAVAAGWLTPRKHIWVEVGRYRQVAVALYRTGDVDALRQLPWADWEAVRACRSGQPSPLRVFAPRPPSRAEVIRRFVAQLADRHQVEVWAWYHGGADRWELDWEQTKDGEPTVEQVEAAIAADPVVGQYRADIELATEGGAAVRWARAMLEPGAAVILDTETIDLPGAICEIAVLDAATGKALLNTLVQPGEPVTLGAYWVHGISDADLVGAPTWPQVLPTLLEVIGARRQILAYNADYDLGVVRADCARHGLDPGLLADGRRWSCLMDRRSDWTRRRRWLPLDGGHRALPDTQAALELLRVMASSPGPARPRGRRGLLVAASAGRKGDGR
jgi:DNA polymerase III epsilon subunit-like protein